MGVTYKVYLPSFLRWLYCLTIIGCNFVLNDLLHQTLISCNRPWFTFSFIRAVASLTVPGGQEFHFPHFFLIFRSIFPQTLLTFFLTLALRVGESPNREGPGYATVIYAHLMTSRWGHQVLGWNPIFFFFFFDNSLFLKKWNHPSNSNFASSVSMIISKKLC